MEYTADAPPKLRISPDDVGKRVSVRSRLGQAVPGARYSDTVGVLTSWSSGELRIIRRDGTSVRLTADSLVAGKVVPDAPTRRRGTPAAGVGELVAVAARGWPARKEEAVGGWLCRAADGWTGRANSALPRYSGPMPPEPDLPAITDWYAAHNLPVMLHVTTGADGSQERLSTELDRRGWEVAGPGIVQVARLAPLADRAPDRRVQVGRELTETWLRGYPNAARNESAARKVLPGGPSVWFATVPATAAGGDPAMPVPVDGDGAATDGAATDAAPAAVGRCVVDGRWAGFAAIQVAPAYRRRGLGGAVLAELARTALADGADVAYLQVEENNEPANSLYTRLGFTVHHRYHYRRPPA